MKDIKCDRYNYFAMCDKIGLTEWVLKNPKAKNVPFYWRVKLSIGLIVYTIKDLLWKLKHWFW